MRIALPTILIAAFCLPSTSRAEDIRAKTADGREVLLKDDGTWSFVKTVEVGKSEEAAIGYEGKHKTFAIHFKPGTWVKSDKSINPVAEAMFTYKEGELYAMIVAERIAVPLDTLKESGLKNMQAADKDAKIVHEEKRKVDGVDVLCVTSELTTQGVPLTFYTYFYSGKSGSIQVATWTGQNLFEEMKPAMEKFLNGLVILKK